MKTARILLYAVIVFIVLLYGTAWLVRSEYQVERTIEIQADYETVFPMISNLREMRHWSPWHDRDPQLEETYEGEDGMPGSIHRWKGNDETGQGQQKIIAIRPDRIDLEVRFEKPFKATNPTWITIDTKSPESVVISWGFKGRIPRPLNLMLLFTDFESAIGMDYEQGLKKLKELAEMRFTEKNPYKDILLQDVTFDMRHFTYTSIQTTFKNLIADAVKVGLQLEDLMKKRGISPFGNLVAVLHEHRDSMLSVHVGFPFENKRSFPGFKNDMLPDGDYSFIPIHSDKYPLEILPEIIKNKLQTDIKNHLVLIDFLDYPTLRDKGTGLIGVFIPKQY
ncbi:MAG: SRPBCC family protein [Thermaurantimonas sp.]